MLPQTQGASFIYHNFLKDILRKHEGKIDCAIDKAMRSASDVGREGVAAAAVISGAALSAAAAAAAKSK